MLEGHRRQQLEDPVTAVRAMLDKDARVTVVHIAPEVAISSGSVATILHEELHLRKKLKLGTSWVLVGY